MIANLGAPTGVLTVSVGVATKVPVRSATPYSLVEEADMAMYAAKASGKGQVSLAEAS